MAYPPLKDARENINVQWYRTKMPPARFRELSTRSDTKAWAQAGGHLALFCLTGACVYFAWANEAWLAFFLALFAHGTVASFFKGTAVHELGHGTVFKTKWLNQTFLYLFSAISWWNPFDYAASHTYHHRYTLHPDGDREVLLPIHPNTGRFFLFQMFTLNLLTQPGRTFGKGGILSAIWITFLDAFGKTPSTEIPANEWVASLHEDQPEEHAKSIWWSRIQLLIHGSILVYVVATGQWVWLLILTAPSFIANWLSYFLGLTQHCGLKEGTTDFRKSTRSIVVPKFVEFLYWRMNWHTEHHMYAGIPCYNLPALAEEIKNDMPKPRTLRQAWHEMLETWDMQQSDPDYGFDTPLPETAKVSRSERNDDEASIGDLAPKGLA